MGIQIAERPGASDFGQLHRWMKLAGTLSAAMISAQAADTWRGPILRYSIDRL
jgi:hypothetical protein